MTSTKYNEVLLFCGMKNGTRNILMKITQHNDVGLNGKKTGVLTLARYIHYMSTGNCGKLSYIPLTVVGVVILIIGVWGDGGGDPTVKYSIITKNQCTLI